MKAIFSNKTINYIVAVSLLPYLIAGISSAAHAESKSTAKEIAGIEGKIKPSNEKAAEKVAEVKATDIKANDAKMVDAKPTDAKPMDTKSADAASKTPTDTDFKKLDGNSDGKLSLKEAVKDKTLAASFDATDVNHDGMLSADEYANYKTASAIKTTEPVPPPATGY